MPDRMDGLADLAREVILQLTASRKADDIRRPWIRASMGQGIQPMFLGIQQHDGRATWVVKHNGDKDVRFPISREKHAVYLFVNGVLANATRSAEYYRDGVRIELLHFDHVLMFSYITSKATRRDFDSMIMILKSVI
jgi:hypothetical protein|uniref:Uncharacterized protein n=1 Tax=Haptolina ericina TaxID=156174 RepID=A0A6T9LVN6_9EUKA